MLSVLSLCWLGPALWNGGGGYQGLAGSGKRHRAAVWKNDTRSEAGDDEREGRHLTLLLAD